MSKAGYVRTADRLDKVEDPERIYEVLTQGRIKHLSGTLAEVCMPDGRVFKFTITKEHGFKMFYHGQKKLSVCDCGSMIVPTLKSAGETASCPRADHDAVIQDFVEPWGVKS